MSRLNTSDFSDYFNNAPRYKDGLAIVQSGVDNKDVLATVKHFRDMRKKFDGLSVYCVLSTTNARGTITKTYKKTGKRGRPKLEIKGNKIDGHLHAIIVNTSNSTNIDEVHDYNTKYFNKRRKRIPHLKQQKICRLDGMFIGKYMDRQADHSYHIGDFDFGYFLDERYVDYF